MDDFFFAVLAKFNNQHRFYSIFAPLNAVNILLTNLPHRIEPL
nr:hypothetical protein [uncultured Campylobacter sp.]